MKSNEYNSSTLGFAPGTPFIAIVTPLVAMTLLEKEQFDVSTKVIIVIASFAMSLLILYSHGIFKALFISLSHFKATTITVFLYFNIVFPLVYLLVLNNNVLTFIWSLTASVMVVFLLVYLMFNFSHKNMQLAGWNTSDKKLLSPQPEGSSFGNKLAIVLAILFLLTIVLSVIYA